MYKIVLAEDIKTLTFIRAFDSKKRFSSVPYAIQELEKYFPNLCFSRDTKVTWVWANATLPRVEEASIAFITYEE